MKSKILLMVIKKFKTIMKIL